MHAWKEQAEVVKTSLRFQVVLVQSLIMAVRFKKTISDVCVGNGAGSVCVPLAGGD